MRDAGSGMPTSFEHLDRAPVAPPVFETVSCAQNRPPSSCMPIVKTGFSDVIGSWKIMLISLPRIVADLVPGELQQIAAR